MALRTMTILLAVMRNFLCFLRHFTSHFIRPLSGPSASESSDTMRLIIPATRFAWLVAGAGVRQVIRREMATLTPAPCCPF